jgi:hypothetical protein
VCRWIIGGIMMKGENKKFEEKSLPIPPVQTDKDCIHVKEKLSL